MPRSISGVLVALAVAVSALAPATASPRHRLADPGLVFIDEDHYMEDCSELLPASAGVAGVTDSGAKVSLDVRVALDFADGAVIEQGLRSSDSAKRADAQQKFDALVAKAKRLIGNAWVSYDPLGVNLVFVRFDLLAPLNADGSPRDRTDNAHTIIAIAKAQYGGRRPAGSDLVYVLTDKDIQIPGVGNAIAGLADCIGGVRYPTRAFAVGETLRDNIGINEYAPNRGGAAKITGHEIGHLMGAHHHYQSCVEGAVTGVPRGDVSPCTLMTNVLNFAAYNFSNLNAVVVRGHAWDFARLTDEEPDPPAGGEPEHP